MTDLPDRFATHLRGARLLSRGGVAIVAVSGGGDSLALLDLLHGVAPALGLALVVAHADHGIRADSRTVGQSVAKIARDLGLPFELGALALGPDATETVARRARYAWLRQVQRQHGARYLVTAHHRDDQIETVMLRVLRGTAPAGLAGIRPRSRGGLVRPLLPFTRAELLAHVAARGLPYHDDPANRDPAHLRSWLRHAVLPQLVERLGPRFHDDVVRLAEQAAADRAAWDAALDLAGELRWRRTENGFDVARAVLRGYDATLAAALLRAGARRAGLVLGPRRAAQVLTLLGGQSGRRIPLGDGWEAEVAFDRLRVARVIGCAVERISAPAERGSAAFGAFSVQWQPQQAPATLDRGGWQTWLAAGEWEVRAPRRGDRLLPLGGVGHRPLRRLLMEARVPRSERAGWPVVARGATILWVPGVCRSAEALPGPGTPAVRLDVIRSGQPPEANR